MPKTWSAHAEKLSIKDAVYEHKAQPEHCSITQVRIGGRNLHFERFNRQISKVIVPALKRSDQ